MSVRSRWIRRLFVLATLSLRGIAKEPTRAPDSDAGPLIEIPMVTETYERADTRDGTNCAIRLTTYLRICRVRGGETAQQYTGQFVGGDFRADVACGARFAACGREFFCACSVVDAGTR